jgi:mannose/fructose/N-acetylgalactosamine-specific phosphotransferase system component IIB
VDPAVFLRIDERLLHGQVLVAWAAALRPQRIVLASDAVAADAAQRAIYESLPRDDYEIGVAALAEAATLLQAGGRVLAVVASPADALRLVELGAGVTSVNLGGLRGPEKRQLAGSVFLGREDAAALRALVERGVAVEVRELPASRRLVVDAATLDRLWPS